MNGLLVIDEEPIRTSVGMCCDGPSMPCTQTDHYFNTNHPSQYNDKHN